MQYALFLATLKVCILVPHVPKVLHHTVKRKMCMGVVQLHIIILRCMDLGCMADYTAA